MSTIKQAVLHGPRDVRVEERPQPQITDPSDAIIRLGLAMKMFGIDGQKLMDEEPDATTFDLVLKNSPIFIANTARHYLFIEEIANNAPTYLARGILGLHQLLSDLLTGKGTLQQPDWA